MKKLSLAVLTSVALALPYAGTANAVTDGVPDGEGHPFVGLLIFDAVRPDGTTGPYWRCSGTLLSSTVLLTAGHCTDGALGGRVWFESDARSLPDYPLGGVTSVEFASIKTHPQFNDGSFVLHDVGVVILSTPVVRTTYGVLPTVDQLDALKVKRGKQDVTFTAVGYGLQKSFPDPVSYQKNEAYKIRMVATPHLIQINTPGFTGDFSLLLSNNAATGGTCFGDSGGPNFLGSSNVIARRHVVRRQRQLRRHRRRVPDGSRKRARLRKRVPELDPYHDR